MYKVLTFEQAYGQLQNDVVTIGQLPVNENAEDYTGDALELVNAYIQQLIRKYSRPPAGCEFFVLKSKDTSARGYYYEAALSYPSNLPRAVDYAYNVECGDLFWDRKAIEALSNPKLGLRIVKKDNPDEK